MTTGHLSDVEIQEYILNRAACEKDIITHMETCEKCRIQEEAYRLLFSGIRQQPKPDFDFELAELVLSQIQPGRPKFSFEVFFPYILAFIVLCLASVPLYLFRVHLLNMITGISPLFFYIIIGATFTIGVF